MCAKHFSIILKKWMAPNIEIIQMLLNYCYYLKTTNNGEINKKNSYFSINSRAVKS